MDPVTGFLQTGNMALTLTPTDHVQVMDPITGLFQMDNLTLTLPAIDVPWNNSTSTPPIIDPSNVLGKVGAAVIVLIIIVGLTGNIQVLVVIARCPPLHRSYNVFIASLSATDLVFNALILPFFVDSYIHRSWRYPKSLCQFLTYFGAMMLITSGLHIGLIAVNRYFLIVHPRRFPDVSSRPAIACQVACVWVIAFLIVLPGVLGYHAAVGYSDQLGRCNYLRSESRVTLSVIFCVGFLLPCAIMGYCYVIIWRTAIRSQRRICLHRTHLPGGKQPLDLLRTQKQSSDVTSSLRMKQLLLFPLESIGSTRSCRKTLGCLGAESLGLIPRETVSGPLNANRLAPPGPLMPPESTVFQRPYVSLGSVMYSGPLGSPKPILSSGPLVSFGPSTPPRPIVRSPGPSVPPRSMVHPGPLQSPYSPVSTGHLGIESNGSLSQEAKLDPGNDGLGQPTGGESLTAPAFTGQSSLDEEVMEVPAAAASEPLYPDLIEQLPVTPSVDGHPALSEAATVQLSDTDANASPCCLEFWCTRAEPSVTFSYAECDSRVSQAAKDGDDDESVDRSRSQINRKMTSSSSRWRRQSIAGRGRLSSLRMILVVFLAFVLTYLPFALMNLFDDGSRLHRSWYMTASLGFWAGSCVNPIIYGVMNRQFRNAYAALLSIAIN